MEIVNQGTNALKKKSKTPDNSGNMCTFAEMTILSGQSRLFHEYSKHLLLATAPLQENQDVLPLKNFDGLELVSYNNNERNNGVSSLYVDCTKTNVVGDCYNARELRIPFSVPYSGNANNLHVDVRSIGLDYDLQVNPVLEFSRVDNDFLYLILQRRVISENGQGLECNPLPFKGPPYNFGFRVEVFEKNCVSENTCINPDYLTELNSNVQCEQLNNVYDADPYITGGIPCNEFFKEENNGVFTRCKFGFQETDLGSEPTAFCVTGEQFNECVEGSDHGSGSGDGDGYSTIPPVPMEPPRFKPPPELGSEIGSEKPEYYLREAEEGSGSGSGSGKITLQNVPAALSESPCEHVGEDQYGNGFLFYEGGSVLLPEGLYEDGRILEDDYMNIIRDGDQKYDAIIAKRNLTEQVLNYNQSMTICSHDALFSQNDEEMDDLNAQRRASGKLPYSTGTEFVVNKFRMHFFHGSDLHDGTGVEDNFVLLLSLHNLELEPIVNDPPIPEDDSGAKLTRACVPRTVTVNGSTGHAKFALRNQLRSCPGPGPGPAQCASHGPGATVTWTVYSGYSASGGSARRA